MDEVMNDSVAKREENENHRSSSEQQHKKPKERLHFVFKDLTGYATKNFERYAKFANWVHREVDGSALGVFRFFYGAAMLIDIAEERGGGQLDVRFGEPNHCHFPLFNGIQALQFPMMGCIYLLMWLGAIGIMIGYRFRLSCLAFILPYWYIFLLDKPAWNNHSYLFGLVGSMLFFTRANNYCSIDRLLNPTMPTTIPYWNYFIIKYQFFLLYMYAGLKKFTAEWLSGYAMSSLSRHWVFAPIRSVLSPRMTDLLVVHWFTAIFDFSIAFLMTWQKTRLFALPFMISFHLMNSRLFIIGMFPWVCLAQVPTFFGFDWPKKLFSLKYLTGTENSEASSILETRKISMSAEETSNSASVVEDYCNEKTNEVGQQRSVGSCTSEDNESVKIAKTVCDHCRRNYRKSEKNSSNGNRFRTAAILAYCALQLFLPYSHFITKGYNNWTNGLYGYSWDMMVHSYDTVLTSIKIVDNSNGEVHFLNPYAYTEYDRWTKYADMALQYAKCIANNILNDYTLDPISSPLSSTNISIYFDIWCSMNQRFQQRVFDPRTDLLNARWSPFERTSWSLPLLNELNHLRPRLQTIANEVLAWNNFSDVIFIADFPGLTLDNYISTDLTNISLTILEGNVRYKSDDETESYFLTAGKNFALKNSVMHHVTTIGSKPSCFMYTFVNKTMLDSESFKQDQNLVDPKPILPLWSEFQARVENYLKFLSLMGNCVLYLLHGVPIPMEVRDKN